MRKLTIWNKKREVNLLEICKKRKRKRKFTNKPIPSRKIMNIFQI